MTSSDPATAGEKMVAEHERVSSTTGRMPRRALGVALVVAGLGVALDQGTKALAVSHLVPGDRLPLVGDLLGLSLVYNPGAAFSLGSGATWIFSIVGVLAAVVTIFFAARLRGPRWGLALGLVLGGAVGNLVDRLVNPPSFGQGHVTDFIAYGNLFVGNVADVIVVVGVALVCLLYVRSSPGDGRETRRETNCRNKR
jgi:signal peptidase II